MPRPDPGYFPKNLEELLRYANSAADGDVPPIEASQKIAQAAFNLNKRLTPEDLNRGPAFLVKFSYREDLVELDCTDALFPQYPLYGVYEDLFALPEPRRQLKHYVARLLEIRRDRTVPEVVAHWEMIDALPQTTGADLRARRVEVSP